MKTKTVAIDEDVQDVLNRSTVLGNNLKLPDEQLDRALFEKVNKALTAIGGKWSRKFRCHVFPFDPSEFITKGVETGSVVNRQQTLQFFQTPVELAERMVRLVCADCLDTVLEPSAGHGRIVDALVRTGARVQAYEIDPTNANIVREKYSHVFVLSLIHI